MQDNADQGRTAVEGSAQEPDGEGRGQSKGERAILRVSRGLAEDGDIFTAQIALNEEVDAGNPIAKGVNPSRARSNMG